MGKRGPRYSKEEFARRGDELYERVVTAMHASTAMKPMIIRIQLLACRYSTAPNANIPAAIELTIGHGLGSTRW